MYMYLFACVAESAYEHEAMSARADVTPGSDGMDVTTPSARIAVSNSLPFSYLCIG